VPLASHPAAPAPPYPQAIYGTFVEAAIPAGDAPITGNEPTLIQGFKAALGLSDVDAAPVHIDVGRRILRGRMEAGSRGEDIEVGAGVGAWWGCAGMGCGWAEWGACAGGASNGVLLMVLMECWGQPLRAH